ncbi:MAG TPA: NYN domain-containing protein [Candidatus Angelobacter sp.]|jgi:uncharacterized LabA/DUF88 family protein|nr:NYN domain-containing protein [Candidatus Angelobacter sp.]
MEDNPNKPKTKVYGFVDGFNLYHAIDHFDHGVDDSDKARYRKYKWLCLTSLIKRFVAPKTEELAGIEYFTTYPTWDDGKRMRHQVFASAQAVMGVHYTLGNFKDKTVTCRAECKHDFTMHEEKQTDINIAVAMIDFADRYDKLILVTADSDQVPAVKLLRKLYPEKRVAVLPPIGRGAKELSKVCHETFKMTEDHLKACQLPNPLPIHKNAVLIKPPTWG